MAAPGSYNFVQTRDNLITDALLYNGALQEGATPSANLVTEASRLLNMMCKLRASEGMPLWMIRRATILPVTEVSKVNTTSHIVTNYGTTQLSTAAADTATTLVVDSTTDMAASDQIGIEMDDGTIHWTTIVSVDSGTGLTITNAIDDDAAVDNWVYFYTASADRIPVRPLQVMNANVLNVSSNASWEITTEERQDYFNLGNRTSKGVPNRIFFDPILGTRTADPTSSTTWYADFYIYPRFDKGEHVIEFTYVEPMQDFDASTDNPYWPQEFYLPLMLELSALLGPRYGVSPEDRKAMFNEAKQYREDALATLQQTASVFIQPEMDNG